MAVIRVRNSQRQLDRSIREGSRNEDMMKPAAAQYIRLRAAAATAAANSPPSLAKGTLRRKEGSRQGIHVTYSAGDVGDD